MTEQQTRVNSLIERIEAHQKSLNLPDVRFVARYQEYLRSTKSWRDRLIPRAWDEIGRALSKWEGKLNALVALIDGGQDIGEYYESLPIAKYAESAERSVPRCRTGERTSRSPWRAARSAQCSYRSPSLP